MKIQFLSFLFFWTFMIYGTPSQGQQQLEIDVNQAGIISAELETILDNIVVQVRNLTPNPISAHFTASLAGRDAQGRLIRIDNILSELYEVVIEPTGENFTIRRLIEEYQNSTIEDYNFLPAEIRNEILQSRRLPEGRYQICVEASSYPFGELISEPLLESCFLFEIEYLDPPFITSPDHNSLVVENPSDEIMIYWTMPQARGGTTFLLEMVRFDTRELAVIFDSQGRPDDIFDAMPRILEQDEIIGFSYSTLQFDSPVDLEPRDIIGLRVTAVNPDLTIRQEGRSRIILFHYGVSESSACRAPNVSGEFVFPMPGDTIPFTRLYGVTRIQPDCDNYTGMDYRFNFSSEGTEGRIVTGAEKSYDFTTAGSPRQYLTDFINNSGSVYSSRMNYYFPDGSDRHLCHLVYDYDNGGNFELNRGDRFAFVGRVEVGFNNVLSGRFDIRSFSFNEFAGNFGVAGMPKPRLSYPQEGLDIAPGVVGFGFDTGLPPATLVPPYKMYSVIPGYPPQVFPLRIVEKCVLQIATDRSFAQENMVFSQVKKIQVNVMNSDENFNEDNPVIEPFSATYDLTPELEINESAVAQKVYKDLTTTTTLGTNGNYFWRVVWLTDPASVNVLNPHIEGINITDDMIYHASAIRSFTISPDGVSGTGGTEAEESPEESACSAPCTFPAITDNEPVRGPRTTETFRAAGFTFTVTESNGDVNSLTGEGTVQIPWLNNVKLECDFSGIRVNNSGQMVSGEITLKKDDGLPEINTRMHELGQLLNIGDHQARAIESMIVAGNKLVRILATDQTTTLPIGIDREIDGRTIIVGIPEMVFRKDTAFMHLVVNIEIPEIEVAGGAISLGSKVCITNGGPANDVKLFLPRDINFPLGNGHEFRINGADGRTEETYVTSVEFDCNGFRALNLAGSVLFDRSVLLPEKADGTIDTTSTVKVRGQFSVRLDQGINALIQLEIDRFQAVDLPNWSFQATGVSFDLSDRSNPAGLRRNLPAGYNHAAFNAGGMENTWKGFYMQSLQIMTPHALKADGGDRLTFTVEGLIIDPDISFNIYATNIARWTESDEASTFNGWSASLDTVQFVMVQNIPRKLGFSGKVGLPVAERTQYVKYSANLMLTSRGNNLVIQARPDGNLTIPIAMAQAVITDNTYLRASVGDTNYIEVNLCATFGFSNTHAPRRASGESQMNQSFNLPSIAIQNLRVNTSGGMIDSVFAFSLDGGRTWRGRGRGLTGGDDDDDDDDGPRPGESDTESDLGGFPIGLRQLSFANEKVSIEPYITLGSGDGGFSASALIDIGLSFGDNFDRFDVTGIDLRKICLNVMASDVKIAGCVEFYKDSDQVIGGINGRSEGVRGGITMEFNMGTKIGLDINANFGTFKATSGSYSHGSAGWFDYFYVDGMAYISSGITIMSGVSLFGVGGGFWHRMSQDSLLLPSTASVADFEGSQPRNGEEGESDDTPPGESSFRTYTPDASVHARYRPDHDIALGLRFTVILGSNDMGKAYNLDASLSAVFSESSGLIHIGINGNFRVMSDGISMAALRGESEDPLSGEFGVNLRMPGDGSFTFDGYFNLKVKVPFNSPILSGVGEGGYAVRAEFLVNNTGYWYFYMGRPEPGRYCGLQLAIGGQTIAELKSYIMIGNGIPLTMPEPDERFMSIFYEAAGMREPIRSADGDPASFLNGAPRDETAATGDGFALGMSLALNIPPVPLPPFYFDLQFVLGFDINVTQDNTGTRRCAGTSIRPGANNNYWYATGQMYAGIRGSFGLGIPYFIPDFKVEIFRGAAAILMQGGLLGPDWFAARGHFRYDVMGHSGSCNFRSELGTVCLPTLGNPFSGIDLIEDVSPNRGARDVSVYSDVSSAFAVEMERDYEFPEMVLQGDPPVIRIFKPYVKYMEITESSATGIIVPVSGEEWSNENKVLTKTFSRPLASNITHFVKIECRIGERKFGRYSDVPKTPGSSVPFKNDTLLTFTTGLEPDILSNEIIDFTYPYLNQRNFMKGETFENKGIIRATFRNNRALTPLTRTGSSVSVLASTSQTDRFYVRFTSDRDTITSPAELFGSNQGVTFDVSRLVPNTIYCAQLIRYNPIVPPVPQFGTNGRPVKNVTITNYGNLSAGDAGTVNLDGIVSRVRLPQGNVNRGEKEIYAFYFKTSLYNTLQAKMNAERSDWTVENRPGWGIDFKYVSSPMDEDFEWLDNEAFISPATRGVKTYRPEGSIEFGVNGNIAMAGDLYDPDFVQNTYLRTQFQREIYDRFSRAHQVREQVRSRNILISSLPYIMSNHSETNFSNRMVRFVTTGRNLHFSTGPLTQAELANNFRDAVVLPGGFLSYMRNDFGLGGTAGMLPTSWISRGTSTNALILYNAHSEGLGSLITLQTAMRRFQMTRVSVNPFTNSPVRDLMSASERSEFDRTCLLTLNEMVNIMRPVSGVNHQFTMRYRFPNVNGGTDKGSRYNYSFTY
jgi:hypothetical protein